METKVLYFKYDVEYKDKKYKAGETHKLQLESYEFDRLTRMGCIYASESAEYTQEEKKEEKQPVKKKKTSKKVRAKKDVDHKDSEQTEVQADNSDKE